MEQIDNGDIHINNIIPKMQMTKALIDELKMIQNKISFLKKNEMLT